MKRFAAFLLTLLLVFTLCSCGKKHVEEQTVPPAVEDQTGEQQPEVKPAPQPVKPDDTAEDETVVTVPVTPVVKPAEEVKPQGGTSGGGHHGGGGTTVNDLTITEGKNVSGGTYKDVIIAESVGDGTVTLENVTIDGQLIIRGGGSNSVKVKNSKVKEVKLDKDTSTGGEAPRLELTGTEVKTVEVAKPAIIEAKDTASTVETLSARDDVTIKGAETKVATVTVLDTSKESVKLTVNDASVAMVTAEAPVTIETNAAMGKTPVQNVEAKANVTVTGAATNVGTVTVNTDTGNGVTLTVEDAKVKNVSAKTPVTIEANANAAKIDTVEAKANVTVEGENTKINTITVPETVTTKPAINVSAGSVNTVEAKSEASVSGGENAIANVEAAASVEVASAAVAKVTVTVNVTVTVTGNKNVEVAVEVETSDSEAVAIVATQAQVNVSTNKEDAPAVKLNNEEVAHIHKWVESDRGDAACTADGHITYVCTAPNCPITNREKTETIPAKGHTGMVVPAVEPTCTAKGKTAGKVCADCGAELVKQTEVDQLGHSYGNYVSDEANHWKVCARCGEIAQKAVHHYSTTSCTAAAKCTGCGYQKAAGVHTWDAGTVKTAATCEQVGSMEYTCTSCHEKETRSIPALGHVYGAPEYVWKDTSCTATRACTRDGCSHKETETVTSSGYELKKPTCTEKGVTVYTGTFKNAAFTAQTKQVETDMKAHTLTHVDAKSATCTAAGNNEYWTCSVCKQAFSDAQGTEKTTVASETNMPLGHQMTEHLATAATCTEPGNSAYCSCSRCDKSFSDSQGKTEIAANSWVIMATGHTFSTAWEHDATEHWHAATCEHTEEVSGKATHSWNIGEVTTAPTCTKTGVKTYTCTVCSATKTEEVVALGHTYGTPTYTWNGNQCTAKHVCTRSNCTHEETETVTAVASVTQENTCILDELSTYTATFTNSAFTTQTKTNVKTADKLGHQLTKTDAKAATCEEAGNSEYWICSRCEKVFSDAQGVTETTVKDRTIAALEHDWAEAWSTDGTYHWHVCSRTGCAAVDAKAEHTPGAAATETVAQTCTACGYELAPATGHLCVNHLTKTDAVAATCTQPGNRAYWSCACGEYYSDANAENKIEKDSWILPVIAHTFDQEKAENTYLKDAATCTAKAVYYKSCTCGAKGTETFEYGDVLGHSFTNYVSNGDATCTADGTKTAKCDRCDATDTVEDTGSKLDHSFTNKASAVKISDATCTARAVYKVRCDSCDAVSDNVTVAVGELDPNNHTGTPGEWQTDSSTHWKVYSCCHAKVDEAAHSGGTATCKNKAVCAVCNAGYGELDQNNHSYGEISYVWNGNKCTATRVCANEGSHVETETVDGVYTVQKAATYTEDGSAVYKATFTNTAFAEQTSETVTLPATPFKVGANTYATYEEALAAAKTAPEHIKDKTFGFEYDLYPTVEIYGSCTMTDLNVATHEFIAVKNGGSLTVGTLTMEPGTMNGWWLDAGTLRLEQGSSFSLGGVQYTGTNGAFVMGNADSNIELAGRAPDMTGNNYVAVFKGNITQQNTFTMGSSYMFFNEQNSVLTVKDTLTNNAYVDNRGTILIDGGTLTNNGTIDNESDIAKAMGVTGQINILSEGTLTNEASAKITGGSIDAFGSTVTNAGTINNKKTIEVYGGTLNNSGEIVGVYEKNDIGFEDWSTYVSIEKGATLSNTGTITDLINAADYYTSSGKTGYEYNNSGALGENARVEKVAAVFDLSQLQTVLNDGSYVNVIVSGTSAQNTVELGGVTVPRGQRLVLKSSVFDGTNTYHNSYKVSSGVLTVVGKEENVKDGPKGELVTVGAPSVTVATGGKLLTNGFAAFDKLTVNGHVDCEADMLLVAQSLTIGAEGTLEIGGEGTLHCNDGVNITPGGQLLTTVRYMNGLMDRDIFAQSKLEGDVTPTATLTTLVINNDAKIYGEHSVNAIVLADSGNLQLFSGSTLRYKALYAPDGTPKTAVPTEWNVTEPDEAGYFTVTGGYEATVVDSVNKLEKALESGGEIYLLPLEESKQTDVSEAFGAEKGTFFESQYHINKILSNKPFNCAKNIQLIGICGEEEVIAVFFDDGFDLAEGKTLHFDGLNVVAAANSTVSGKVEANNGVLIVQGKNNGATLTNNGIIQVGSPEKWGQLAIFGENTGDKIVNNGTIESFGELSFDRNQERENPQFEGKEPVEYANYADVVRELYKQFHQYPGMDDVDLETMNDWGIEDLHWVYDYPDGGDQMFNQEHPEDSDYDALSGFSWLIKNGIIPQHSATNTNLDPYGFKNRSEIGTLLNKVAAKILGTNTNLNLPTGNGYVSRTKYHVEDEGDGYDTNELQREYLDKLREACSVTDAATEEAFMNALGLPYVTEIHVKNSFTLNGQADDEGNFVVCLDRAGWDHNEPWTVVVEPDAALTVNDDVKLIVNGSVIVRGKLVNKGRIEGETMIDVMGGELENGGTIDLYGEIKDLAVEKGGKLRNFVGEYEEAQTSGTITKNTPIDFCDYWYDNQDPLCCSWEVLEGDHTLDGMGENITVIAAAFSPERVQAALNEKVTWGEEPNVHTADKYMVVLASDTKEENGEVILENITVNPYQTLLLKEWVDVGDKVYHNTAYHLSNVDFGENAGLVIKGSPAIHVDGALNNAYLQVNGDPTVSGDCFVQNDEGLKNALNLGGNIFLMPLPETSKTDVYMDGELQKEAQYHVSGDETYCISTNTNLMNLGGDESMAVFFDNGFTVAANKTLRFDGLNVVAAANSTVNGRVEICNGILVVQANSENGATLTIGESGLVQIGNPDCDGKLAIFPKQNENGTMFANAEQIVNLGTIERFGDIINWNWNRETDHEPLEYVNFRDLVCDLVREFGSLLPQQIDFETENEWGIEDLHWVYAYPDGGNDFFNAEDPEHSDYEAIGFFSLLIKNGIIPEYNKETNPELRPWHYVTKAEVNELFTAFAKRVLDSENVTLDVSDGDGLLCRTENIPVQGENRCTSEKNLYFDALRKALYGDPVVTVENEDAFLAALDNPYVTEIHVTGNIILQGRYYKDGKRVASADETDDKCLAVYLWGSGQNQNQWRKIIVAHGVKLTLAENVKMDVQPSVELWLTDESGNGQLVLGNGSGLNVFGGLKPDGWDNEGNQYVILGEGSYVNFFPDVMEFTKRLGERLGERIATATAEEIEVYQKQAEEWPGDDERMACFAALVKYDTLQPRKEGDENDSRKVWRPYDKVRYTEAMNILENLWKDLFNEETMPAYIRLDDVGSPDEWLDDDRADRLLDLFEKSVQAKESDAVMVDSIEALTAALPNGGDIYLLPNEDADGEGDDRVVMFTEELTVSSNTNLISMGSEPLYLGGGLTVDMGKKLTLRDGTTMVLAADSNISGTMEIGENCFAMVRTPDEAGEGVTTKLTIAEGGKLIICDKGGLGFPENPNNFGKVVNNGAIEQFGGFWVDCNDSNQFTGNPPYVPKEEINGDVTLTIQRDREQDKTFIFINNEEDPLDGDMIENVHVTGEVTIVCDTDKLNGDHFGGDIKFRNCEFSDVTVKLAGGVNYNVRLDGCTGSFTATATDTVKSAKNTGVNFFGSNLTVSGLTITNMPGWESDDGINVRFDQCGGDENPSYVSTVEVVNRQGDKTVSISGSDYTGKLRVAGKLNISGVSMGEGSMLELSNEAGEANIALGGNRITVNDDCGGEYHFTGTGEVYVPNQNGNARITVNGVDLDKPHVFGTSKHYGIFIPVGSDKNIEVTVKEGGKDPYASFTTEYKNDGGRNLTGNNEDAWIEDPNDVCLTVKFGGCMVVYDKLWYKDAQVVDQTTTG